MRYAEGNPLFITETLFYTPSAYEHIVHRCTLDNCGYLDVMYDDSTFHIHFHITERA